MKKQLGLTIAFILLSSLVILPHTTVRAQSKTIIVPDDYPTITDAIGNATNGETIFVRSGIYNETSLQTNKTISLIGEGEASTIVNLYPPSLPFYIGPQLMGSVATAIEFNANNIVISGFTINSYGTMSITGNNEVVTGNIINAAMSIIGNDEVVTGNVLNGSTVTGNQEKIYNNTSNAVIDACCTHSTICSNSGTGGIVVDGFYSSNSVFFFEGSFNSIFDNNMKYLGEGGESSSNLYYGNTVNDGNGISVNLNDILVNNTVTNCNQGVTTGSNDMIVGNKITNNSGAGMSTTGLNNMFWANYVANNQVGIITVSSSEYNGGNFTIYENDFINNTRQTQVSDSQGGPWSDDCWNYSGHGNYWSNYLSIYPNASEVGSSGIWNTPYYVGGGEQDNYPLMVPFDISSVNIQLPSWANITVPSPPLTPSFPSQNLANPKTTSTLSPTSNTSASAISTATVPKSTAIDTTAVPIGTLVFEFILAIVVLVAIISLLVYGRHRKTPKAMIFSSDVVHALSISQKNLPLKSS